MEVSVWGQGIRRVKNDQQYGCNSGYVPGRGHWTPCHAQYIFRSWLPENSTM